LEGKLDLDGIAGTSGPQDIEPERNSGKADQALFVCQHDAEAAGSQKGVLSFFTITEPLAKVDFARLARFRPADPAVVSKIDLI
jgi:hypothetical protein